MVAGASGTRLVWKRAEDRVGRHIDTVQVYIILNSEERAIDQIRLGTFSIL